jgi:hypothetical protein
MMAMMAILCTTANGQNVTDPNATAKCDPLFECPPPVPTSRIVLDILWTLWNFLLVGYWIYMIFVKLSKTNNFLGPAVCILVAALFEGIFFILKTILNLNPSNPYVVYPWGLGFQIYTSCALWMLAFFFSRAGWQWTTKECICRLVTLLVIATLAATILIKTVLGSPSMQSMALVQPIFLAMFEPPQIFILCFAMANACHKDVPCSGFTVFFTGFALLFAVHISSIAVMSRRPAMFNTFYFFYIPAQLIASAMVQFGMTKLMVEKEFERQDHKLNHVLESAGIDLAACIEEKKTQQKNAIRTQVWSPELIYSAGVIGVLAGYVASATCLFLITKPDLNSDPVFRLYGTLHPCILLDYLPGTLAAQPCFGAGILLSQFSMLAALFRTAAYGDATATLLQAMLFGWYWLLSAFFILVFTFNPTITTVLLHSVPYMTMNVGNAFFVVTTIVIMFRWKGIRGKTVSTFCGGFYVFAIVYGTFFMSGKLMSHEGMNLLEKSAGSAEALDATKDLKPDFDPGPMVLTLIAQAVILSFGLMSPLRYRPLAFDLYSREANVPTKYVGNPNEEKQAEAEAAQHASFSAPVAGARNFRLQMKARTPFIITVLALGFTLFAASEFDRRVYPDRSEHDYREIFRRSPGAAIVAVGWMMIANFLAVHVMLAVMHEWYTNDSAIVKYWVAFAGLFFLVCALVAHAGTIPNQGESGLGTEWFRNTDWFKGVEVFMVSFGLWLFTDALLCVQTLMRIVKGGNDSDLADEDEEEDENCCSRFLKPMLVLEIILALVGGICLILLGFRVPSMMFDKITCFIVLLFSAIDARGVDVIFATMRVATPTDLLIKDIDGDWHLPNNIINSIAVDEDGYEYEVDGDTMGKGTGEYEAVPR